MYEKMINFKEMIIKKCIKYYVCASISISNERNFGEIKHEYFGE